MLARPPTLTGGPVPTRRALVLGGLAVAATGLSGCSPVVGSDRPAALPVPTPQTPSPGGRVVTARLTAQPATIDLGGPVVRTWAYGDTVPGSLLRATAGDVMRVHVENRLPAETTVHWHGIRLQNAADGVPGVTQAPIAAGSGYDYEFVVPDPGTYFFHPHVGVQLDRGLYAPLVVDDPDEPGAYDDEWVVVLDDWVDGTGRTPDDVLAGLVADGGGDQGDGMGMGMGGMDHGMGEGSERGSAGDVDYPHYLVNGRVPAAPETFRARPGDRVRIRIVNAAADTLFTVALGGHRMTVTHTDGFPVEPLEVAALPIAMGERYDVVVTLGDGVFPFAARPEGKSGEGLALVRTGSGSAPAAGTTVPELDRAEVLTTRLVPTDAARLPGARPEQTRPLTLNGSMSPFRWGINGAPYGENDPLRVDVGRRVRLEVTNMTMMSHPIHLHGHTFALSRTGLRKDTVLVPPMGGLSLDLDTDNPGRWMTHCHNIYHAEAGMMTTLEYTS